MMEVTASGLVTQRFLHGMQASQLDVVPPPFLGRRHHVLAYLDRMRRPVS
jgi:hypothetical protein